MAQRWGDYYDLPDGRVRLDISDGSSMVMSSRAEDARMESFTNGEGDVFSQYDDADPPNPHHVRFNDGRTGEYSYPPDGTMELAMDDQSLIVMSGTGEGAVILRHVTPEGDIYSNFTTDGHPGHVVFHD